MFLSFIAFWANSLLLNLIKPWSSFVILISSIFPYLENIFSNFDWFIYLEDLKYITFIPFLIWVLWESDSEECLFLLELSFVLISSAVLFFSRNDALFSLIFLIRFSILIFLILIGFSSSNLNFSFSVCWAFFSIVFIYFLISDVNYMYLLNLILILFIICYLAK